MLETLALSADTAGLYDQLEQLSHEGLDELEFGVIGFDNQGIVRLYNRFEAQLAGMSAARSIGQALFTGVAPCMNNFMVAQHYEDALRHAHPLDTCVDWVFTLRMRPAKVKLRLLAKPGQAMRYVVVTRRG
jgi:photoactive yellow protein